MSAPAPFWLARYLPDAEDAPGGGQSWAERLERAGAEEIAAEAERLLREEQLRTAAHSGRPLSQKPHARMMREWRLRKRLREEAVPQP
jgi:hypothetical protein